MAIMPDLLPDYSHPPREDCSARDLALLVCALWWRGSDTKRGRNSVLDSCKDRSKECKTIRSRNVTTDSVQMDVSLGKGFIIQNDDEYVMKSFCKRGVFVIINNRRFFTHHEREGTEFDAEELEKVFTKLDFDVKPYHDKTADEMLDIISEVANEDHSDHDCFVCAILSHGDEEHVCGIDHKIKIDDLIKPFKEGNCLSLKGKPKFFIFQSCRGRSKNADFEGNDDELRLNIFPSSVEPDFLYAYSTVHGLESLRKPSKGSRFIQSLCDVLDNYGHRLEIVELLTKVNFKVAFEYKDGRCDAMNLKKQTPSIVSNLTKQLYLSPSRGAASDDADYGMCQNETGVFLIINNRHGGSSMTNIDADNLAELFSGYGFKVRQTQNQTTKQMLDILEEVANEDHTEHNCFMCAILADGAAGIVYGTDDRTIEIEKLISSFKGQKCPTLIGKPKIFIILTCSCDYVEEQADSAEMEIVTPKVPGEADFLYTYASVPGNNDRNERPCVVQTLCKVFQYNSDKRHNIMALLTKVNRIVVEQMNCKEQILSNVSMLTKQLYLSPREDMPASLPALKVDAQDEPHSMNTWSDEEVYRMNHPKRGVFVIINNRYFENSTCMSDRSGTDVDAANLYQLFMTLGFDVRLEQNKKTTDMLRILDTVAKEDHSDHDCFMCAILSHGDEGVVYGTDGMIRIEMLTSLFKGRRCPTLVGKPKVFIIQTDRGNKLDHGIEVADGIGEPEQRIYRIPQNADFVYAYSTAPGYFSWRNSNQGSWFIQALCQVFKTDAEKHDILTILTKVSRLVAYDFQSNALLENMNRKKQIPSIVSMLTKQQFLQTNKTTGSDEDLYRMDCPKQGIIVIINNRHFDQSTNMSERAGSDVDAANLSDLFGTLGFDVRMKNNLTVEDMRQTLITVANEDHTNNGCFMCAILSHGDKDLVYGTDGIIPLEILANTFKGDNCPTLVGKPKVFIVQASRGSKVDSGVEVADATEEVADGIPHQAASNIRLPEEADFLYAHSTAPGHISWRNSNKGSWFIQTLCKVFKTDAEKNDILTLLTKVNRLVAYDFQSNASCGDMNHKKQISCIESMLTKQLYLPPKK